MGALTGVAASLMRPRRMTPADRERKRRLNVNAQGRLGSAIITDIHDGVVSYTYWIAGVQYNAAQDISGFEALLPPDPATLIERPTGLKYLPHNPVNSIVMCENWSGLNLRPQVTTP